jgi:CMP-2-keto-3-deoxyoctulosonic acid synthetase
MGRRVAAIFTPRRGRGIPLFYKATPRSVYASEHPWTRSNEANGYQDRYQMILLSTALYAHQRALLSLRQSTPAVLDHSSQLAQLRAVERQLVEIAQPAIRSIRELGECATDGALGDTQR